MEEEEDEVGKEEEDEEGRRMGRGEGGRWGWDGGKDEKKIRGGRGGAEKEGGG